MRLSRSPSGMLTLGEGVAATGVVLMLVRRLAAVGDQLKRALLECGAAEGLRRLQVTGTDTSGVMAAVPCMGSHPSSFVGGVSVFAAVNDRPQRSL